jgi:hypothetical protein
MHSPILAAEVDLVAWSMVKWGWMYATRLPAIFRVKMVMDSNAPRGEQMNSLPPQVRWKADNYNHLMEQPTIFYAIVLSLAVMGSASAAALALAWSYVALRIVHSLVQALVNKIELRFAVFVLSNVPLFGLTGLAAAQLLGH